ncbi:hypothetical protein QTP70_004553, partial [Hemibagrus guttatus]
WNGLNAITSYKTPSPGIEANQQLAEDWNEFYCRFEKQKPGLTPHTRSDYLTTWSSTPSSCLPPIVPQPVLKICEDDVRKVFSKQKIRKAKGPDGVSTACLKACASFERLVLAYLKDITGPLLDPLQFAYRANRSVDDAVNRGLHYILQHLDKPGTYARILFVDFSSAFNTIIPDDTTVIGLIQDGNESAYRQEVEQLAVWCSHNNLELNTLKTVEMIVDFRRNPPALPPLTIMDSTVAAVEPFKFLGTTISQDLTFMPCLCPVQWGYTQIEKFECDYGSNYHPTFEMLCNIKVDKVTLGLLD